MLSSADNQTASQSRFAGKAINFLTIQPHTYSSGELANWFEEETGAKVNVIPVSYGEITDIATGDIASGEGKFDVIEFWYPMLGYLAKKNILKDITGWWEDHSARNGADDFIPVFKDTFCVFEGSRYGIPHDGDFHLLFYNKMLFEKHALQPPGTWDEYLAISKTITDAEKGNGIYGCGIMGADIPLILIGTFLNRLAGFGGSFFDPQGNPSLNSREAVSALEHLITEMPYALPDPTTVAFDEMLEPWFSGHVAMTEFWADLGKMSDNPELSSIAHQWGVVPLPRGPLPKGRVTAPLNAGWSLGVSSSARDEELALAFLGFCLRPEVHLRICIAGGLDPVRYSTYDTPAYRECVSEELACAAQGAVVSAPIAWPTLPCWPELQEILNNTLKIAINHAKEPQQALDDAQNAWKRILNSTKN